MKSTTSKPGGWFQNLWLQKRSGWAQRVDEDQGAVVFLGDSITQGWQDDFRGKFPDVHVANRGISGDTTRGMLIRLQEDVLSLDPAAVVMLMGTNDLEEMATPEQVAANFQLIIERLKEHHTQMPIVVCEVFPSSAKKKRPSDKIKRVNALFRETVLGDPQVTVLDTWTLFANDSGDAKLEEFPDLLHPNDAGYEKWATALRPILATLGFIETEAEPFQLETGFEPLFNGQGLTGWCLLPTTKELKQYRAGAWNELLVVVRGNSAYCTCNGEVLEAEFQLPDSGPIGLEGDRGQMEYRRIRIGPANR